MTAALVALGPALAAVAAPAWADVKDFEFQLVQTEMKKGDGAIVAVRLVNKKTGQPVPERRDLRASASTWRRTAWPRWRRHVEQLPSTEPGVYRFKTNLSMQGRWQLSLGAKVQGETGTVESKLVLKAVP